MESDNSVTMLLIKEDNVLSEQTFLIEVSVQPWSYFATSILPAIQLTQTSIERENIERDFAFPNKSIHLNLQFLPSIQVLPVELTIYDDTIAEGPEGILLHTDIEDRSPSYRIPVYSFSDTRVIIEDNDSKFHKIYCLSIIISTSLQISLLGLKWTIFMCLSGLICLKFASGTTILQH